MNALSVDTSLPSSMNHSVLWLRNYLFLHYWKTIQTLKEFPTKLIKKKLKLRSCWKWRNLLSYWKLVMEFHHLNLWLCVAFESFADETSLNRHIFNNCFFFFFFTECHFGKELKELGSTWFPDLGAPFGKMYCIKCECVPVSIWHRVLVWSLGTLSMSQNSEIKNFKK